MRKKAYRLWCVEKGFRCDGFYEVESLDDLFQQIKQFEMRRYYGVEAVATVQQCTISSACDICSAVTDYEFKINLGVKEQGKEKVTWDDILN